MPSKQQGKAKKEHIMQKTKQLFLLARGKDMHPIRPLVKNLYKNII